MEISCQNKQYIMSDGFAYAFFKRIFDLIGAITGIVIFWPIFMIIALAIKFSSSGPIFYRGTRTGRYGKFFQIFKFRSMVIGAEKGAGTTSRSDNRVTPVGRFLRRYKLDELPQLLNVLAGDMSLVGPRPELPCYTNRYCGEERLILKVKPGITDYSSIRFSNLSDLIDDADPDNDFEDKILPEKNSLRVQYVKNRSFYLDLKLIIITIFKIAGIK